MSIQTINSKKPHRIGSLSQIGNGGSSSGFDFNSLRATTLESMKAQLQGMRAFQGTADSSSTSSANAQTSSPSTTPPSSAADTSSSRDAPNSFVSQLAGSTNKNEDSGSYNGNCGPTCLLMAARMFGEAGGNAKTADNQIEKMRSLMGANPDEKEWTSTDQIANGAEKLGLNAEATQGGVDDVKQAVSEGQKVIVNVNPKEYGGADTGHFAVVTAIEGDKVTLFDPAQQKPITISSSQLQGAMAAQGNNMVKVSENKVA